MTAKEYYAFYTQKVFDDGGKTDDALVALVNAMVHEVTEIVNKRGGGKSASSIYSSVREMNDRWNAICRIDETFHRDGFIVCYRKLIPSFAELETVLKLSNPNVKR